MTTPPRSAPSTPPEASETRRRHLLAVGTALVVTVLWSSSWVLIRVGLDDEDLRPLTFAGLRYALAAIVVVAATATSPTKRRAVAQLDRSTLSRLAVLGVIFYAVTQGAQFVAIDAQPAATTSLVLSLTPLVVGLAPDRSLGEGVAARQLLGAGLVGGGAVLFFAGDLGATAIGVIAALVALLANTVSALLGRRANRSHAVPPLVVTAVSMPVGAALLIGVGLAIEGWPTVSARAAVIIAVLAVINTAVAFTLWNASMRHLSAIESTGINNTMLVQIAALAWIFLGEPPGLAGVVGIVVVSSGVFLTQAGSRAPRRARADG